MGEEEEKVGQTIREYRKKQGINQEDLAKDIGISRSYLSEIERGERNPSFSVVRKIANALDASIWELEGKDPGKMNTPKGLREFAEEDNLTQKQVRMLSEIEHRGKQPEKPEEWRRLFNIIKATLGEET